MSSRAFLTSCPSVVSAAASSSSTLSKTSRGRLYLSASRAPSSSTRAPGGPVTHRRTGSRRRHRTNSFATLLTFSARPPSAHHANGAGASSWASVPGKSSPSARPSSAPSAGAAAASPPSGAVAAPSAPASPSASPSAAAGSGGGRIMMAHGSSRRSRVRMSACSARMASRTDTDWTGYWIPNSFATASTIWRCVRSPLSTARW
mmetsp:Transcript_29525/g.75126  ORF Transcript_29525/g.75126 Transcript_29525/m.75126 type:complete len:204 (+) Transcript_29525:933-1544(+)